MEESLQKLYQQLSQDLSIGDYNSWRSAMNDPMRRRKFFDSVSQTHDIGTFEYFQGKFPQKKNPGETGGSDSSVSSFVPIESATPAGAGSPLINKIEDATPDRLNEEIEEMSFMQRFAKGLEAPEDSPFRQGTEILVNAVKRGKAQGELAGELAFDATVGTPEKISELNKKISAASPSDEYKKFTQSKSFGDATGALFESPEAFVKIATELSLESLTALVRGAFTRGVKEQITGEGSELPISHITTAANPNLIKAFTGIMSMNAEYSGNMMEAISKAGFNIEDANSLREAFSNGENIAKVKKEAIQRGIPVILFDMVSLGIGGRILSKPAKTVAGKLGKGAADFGVQAGLGAAGEGTKQAIFDDELSWGSILAEAVGELGGSAPEVFVGTAIHSKKHGKDTSKAMESVRENVPQEEFEQHIEVAKELNEITPEQGDELINEYVSVNEEPQGGTVEAVPTDTQESGASDTRGNEMDVTGKPRVGTEETQSIIAEGESQPEGGSPSIAKDIRVDSSEGGKSDQTTPSIFIDGEYSVDEGGNVTKNGEEVGKSVATKIKKKQREAHLDRIATQGEYKDLANVPEEARVSEILESDSPAQVAEAWRAEPDKVKGEESLRTEIKDRKFSPAILEETGRQGSDLKDLKNKYQGVDVTDLTELAAGLTEDGRFGEVSSQDILDAIIQNTEEGAPSTRELKNPNKIALEQRFEELAKVPIDEEYADRLIERSGKLREEGEVTAQMEPEGKARIQQPGKGPLKRRGTQTGILEKGRGLSEANESIKKLSDETPDYYRQLNLKDFGKEIANEVEESGGIEAAAVKMMNEGIAGTDKVRNQAKRVVILQGLGLKMNEAVKNNDWREINRIRNMSEAIETQMTESATEAGQQSAVLALWYSTPEGQIARVVSRVREANRAQLERISSSGEPVAKIIDNIMSEVGKQMGVPKSEIKRALGRVAEKKKRIGSSKSMIKEGRKELAAARKKLVTAAMGKATSGIDPAVAGAMLDIVKALAKIFKGNIKMVKSKFMSEARDAGVNGKAYWDHLNLKNPDVFQSMEEFTDKIEEAIYGFYNESNLSDDLKTTLVEVGLDPSEAQAVANDLQSEITDYIKKEKAKKLKNIVRKHEKDKKKAKLIEDSLLSSVILDGLNEESNRKAIEEKYGLKEVTPQQISEINEMVAKAKDMPGQKLRDKELTKVLDYISTDLIGESGVDIAVSLWHSSVLSGPRTMASILIGGITNILGLPLRIMSKGGLNGIKAIIQSMPFIWMEMGSIMRHGTSYKALDKIIKSPVLERVSRMNTKDAGLGKRALKNTAKVARYVGRLMNTIDAVFYYSAASFIHGRAAYRSALGEGLKGSAAKRRANELIAGNKDATNRFIAQAKKELAGKKHTNADIYYRAREIGEQKLAEVDIEAIGKGYELGQRLALMGEARGFWGWAAKVLSKMPLEMIEKNEARMPKGSFKAAGKLFDVYARVTLPYLNVAANMTNLAIDYVPVGGLAQKLIIDRVPWGKVEQNQVLGEISEYEGFLNKFRGSEELRLLVMKQLIGTGLMLFILELALDDEDDLFDITADGPESWQKKSQMYEQALPPYHIKVGDKLINYRDSPLAGALVMIGGINDARKYGDPEKDINYVGRMGSAFAGYFTSASFLKTLGEFAEAIGGKKDISFFTKVFFRPLTGFTNPAIFRHLSKMVSPELKDKKTFGNDKMGKLSGHMLSNTMIAGDLLLDFRYNSLGQPINPHKDMNWFVKGSGLDKYFKSAKPHDKIFDLMSGHNLFFGGISERTKLAGTEMSYNEFKAYAMAVGKYRKMRMDDDYSDLLKKDTDAMKKYVNSLDKSGKSIAKNIVLEYRSKLEKLTPEKIDSILRQEYR